MVFSHNLKKKITLFLLALTLTIPAQPFQKLELRTARGDTVATLDEAAVAVLVATLAIGLAWGSIAALLWLEEQAKRREELDQQRRAFEQQSALQEQAARAIAEAQKAAAIDSPSLPKITFADVIGAESAKLALGDIVQFLKDTQPYAHLGAHLPKGILLEGEPGNGKTLLAKALAGEAGASFVAVNGSEFTDRYLGVGVQRVKELFAQARQHAPCIIFIDEIDGVGKRSGQDDSATLENNRIIAELLTQMDGLHTDPSKPIIVIGATNHRNNVDKALLRSGRCDTIVTVDSPALEARAAILHLYTQKIKASTIDFNLLAEQSEGFSGADLANLVNQAALIAARRRADAVQQADFDQALGHLAKSKI